MQHLTKLLEYVVTKYPALAEAKVSRFFDKFKKQLPKSSMFKDTSDEDLQHAIEEFDKYKNQLPAEDRDLAQWTVQDLLNFLRSKPGYKPPSEIEEELPEDAPPVVFPKEGETRPGPGEPGHGLTIFDGSSEDRCIQYGKGEEWCITKGSFANYRYSEERKFPTFYLVKDDNLPKSNPKSFFVIMVGKDGTFKGSDRTNNDIGGQGSEWDRWQDWAYVESHFPSVRGLGHLFKYRPIPASELTKGGRMSVEDWINYSDKRKQSVLTSALEAGRNPFYGQDWNQFIRVTLPHFRHIGDWFASLAYQQPDLFATNYKYFTDQQKKSIIAHINTPNHPVNVEAWQLINDSSYSHEFIIDLLKANRVPPSEKMHIYADKRNNIVILDLSREHIEVSKKYANGARESYKLDSEDEHYILNDPHFKDIPIEKLQATVEKYNLTPKILKRALEGAGDSIETVKDEESSSEFVIQKPTLSVLQLSGTPLQPGVPYPDKVMEKVDQLVLTDDNARKTLFKQLAKNKFTAYRAAPRRLASVIRELPPQKRTMQGDDDEDEYGYFAPNDELSILYFRYNPSADRPNFNYQHRIYIGGNGKAEAQYGRQSGNNEQYKQAVEYILSTLIPPLTDRGARIMLDTLARRNQARDVNEELIWPLVPRLVRLDDENIYKFAYDGGNLYLLNKFSREGSLMIGPRNNNSINVRLAQARYDQLMGTRPQAAGGETGAAQPAQALPATAQGGDTDLQAVLNAANIRQVGLQDSVARRLRLGGTPKDIRNDRGSSTRNQQLRRYGLGRVTAAYQLAGTASALYMITLESGTQIAVIAMQPGNVHMVLTSNRITRMRSADDLASTIDDLNLRENKNNMNSKTVVLRKLIERMLRENGPMTKPTTKPDIAEPDTEEEEDDRTFEPPDEAPENVPAKAIKEADKVTPQMLVKRYKSENS